MAVTLQEKFKAMRERKEFTDVVLVCDRGEVSAHQMVLAAQSAYFRKMFLSNFKEATINQVDFSHISYDNMILLLDYIYLNSLENILDKDVESLINIFQVSHLFEIEGLNDSLLKIILSKINTDNWINIWELILLHGNDEQISKVLHYVLDNLSEDKEIHFSTLNYSQLTTLLEKFHENNLPMDDKFIEAVIQWIKKTNDPKTNLQKIFLQLNFDFISKEFMNNLLENETNLFENAFVKDFFKIHFLQKLKSRSEIQSCKPLFPKLTANEKFPFKLLYFGCHRTEFNKCFVYKNAGLRIFDCEKQSVCKRIDNLPFLFGRDIFPIQCGFDIYIIGGIPGGVPEPVASDKTKSFFLYDWKNNQVVAKPSLLEEVKNPLNCVSENNIYVIDNNISLTETIIQCYSVYEKKWFSKTYLGFFPVACANVKNVTYLLCTNNNNSGYYYLYRVNQLECIFHSNTPVPYVANEKHSLIHINQRMITVYKDKIFVLSNKPKYSLYIYDPDTQLWDITHTFILHEVFNTGSVHCFANGNNSLMLYNEVDHSLYQFDENIADVKKIMTVKGQLDKTCNCEYNKYEKLLIFQSSFNM